MHELTLEYRPLHQIKPCPTNARMHSAWQVAQIAKSIETTASANPILIDDPKAARLSSRVLAPPFFK